MLGLQVPDLIIISAGFDGHKKDSSLFDSGFQLESDTFGRITRKIQKSFPTSKKIALLEGGYTGEYKEGTTKNALQDSMIFAIQGLLP